MIELEAEIKMVEAATVRGDKDEAERHRSRAHDLLDAHLDAKVQNITLVMKGG